MSCFHTVHDTRGRNGWASPGGGQVTFQSDPAPIRRSECTPWFADRRDLLDGQDSHSRLRLVNDHKGPRSQISLVLFARELAGRWAQKHVSMQALSQSRGRA